MYKIGLTGGIASGKTNAVMYLSARGIPCIDSDAISRTLTLPGGLALPEIKKTFPQAFMNGELNRRALGRIVFNDEEARKTLENIIHPLVFEEIRRKTDELTSAGEKIVVLDIPLLIETQYHKHVDEVWLLAAPESIRLARIMRRNGLSRAEAQARISAQMPQHQKYALATRIIDTSGSMESTHNQLCAALRHALMKVGDKL